MSTATTPSTNHAPLVLTRRDGAITRISLNRPRAINALNREMFSLIQAAVETAQTDGSRAIVLDGIGERGFCGGGDIKEISGPDGREILELEYSVDRAIAQSPIPVIGLMDGITMGGGIGLTGHAHYRVVTERSRLAMPEARIGIMPDVGGNRLLARAPQRLGEYLALTAQEMGPGDAIALGFADHVVAAADLEALCAALAAGEEAGTAVARFAAPTAHYAAPLLTIGEWWQPLLERALGGQWRAVYAEPAAAALRVIAALEATYEEVPVQTAAVMREMCPTSVAVSLAQIARTRAFDFTLAEVLADDLRVCGRLATRPDFAEGVRAQVIDKDRNPAWQPARLEDLADREIAEILSA